MRHEDCPQRSEHTACPSGYVAWHAWAGKKSKTHVQRRCEGCGLLTIWIPKGPGVRGHRQSRPRPA